MSPETNPRFDQLKTVWAGQSRAFRNMMMASATMLGLLVVSGAAGVVWGAVSSALDLRPEPRTVPLAPPPGAALGEAAVATVDQRAALALEQGAPDPAGKLRAIAAGNVPQLQIGYRWIGILKEQSIAGYAGPAGWTAHFNWSRRPWSGATIDVFETESQALSALLEVMDGPARMLLMSNEDGATRYTALNVTSPDGERTYSMRCGVRAEARRFACSTMLPGVPAIVTVNMTIDVLTGPSQAEIQSKVDEMTREMGRETDEVMRALAAQGLDGTQAVVR